jgi:sulfate adenylyltransferase
VPESSEPVARDLPVHSPAPRELDDLELLGNGALEPLDGFGGPEGVVTLRVPPEVARAAREAGGLQLVDPEGAPVGRVIVRSTYAAGALVGISGPVTSQGRHEFGAFRRLHLSPAEVRTAYGPETVSVPVTAPLTDDDLGRISQRAAGRPVLLLALAGTGMSRGLTGTGLIRATLAAAGHLEDAAVVAVPLAAHGSPDLDRELARRVVAAYAPGEVLEVSGRGDLPDDVAAVASQGGAAAGRRGLVVFFTGLSGSGKSTLARALHDVILEQSDRTVTSLDGDVVRRHLSAGLTFSRADRETNILRIGWVAAEISRHGGIVLCSPIAPFDSTRQQVRQLVEDAGGAFVLVHVATPLAECERRDRKGLYAKARRGEIPDFTGISSPYEEPEDATVTVDTTGRSIANALEDVLDALRRTGRLDLRTPADLGSGGGARG